MKKVIITLLSLFSILVALYILLSLPIDPTLKYSFNAGELSTLIKYRVDQKQYDYGAQKVENLIVLPQGGVIRRPGTKFVARNGSPCGTYPTLRAVDVNVAEVNIPHTIAISDINGLQSIMGYSATFNNASGTLAVADTVTFSGGSAIILDINYADANTGTVWWKTTDSLVLVTSGKTFTSGVNTLVINSVPFNCLTGNYYLTNDIDASITTTWNSGKGFMPIGGRYGSNLSLMFSGTLDGCGYTISNLYIYNPISNASPRGHEAVYAALFSFVSSVSSRVVIANLTLEDVSIQNTKSVASLVNQASDYSGYGITIQNCHASGTIVHGSDYYSGGLIAEADGDTDSEEEYLIVDKCSSSVNIYYGVTAAEVTYDFVFVNVEDLDSGDILIDDITFNDVNSTTEDFESGDFNSLDWTITQAGDYDNWPYNLDEEIYCWGQAKWRILPNDNNYCDVYVPHNGEYCANAHGVFCGFGSGNCDDWTTTLSITLTSLPFYEPLTFWSKKEGQQYADYLRLYKNGSLIYSESEPHGWRLNTIDFGDFYLFDSGGLIGWSYAVNVTDCNVTGNYYTAGFVGDAYYSSFTNCKAFGYVKNAPTSRFDSGVGGFVGLAERDNVFTGCSATGNVNDSRNNCYTGGFVGYTWAGSSYTNIFDRCSSSGSITCNSSYDTGWSDYVSVGGFAGYLIATNDTFLDCYSWSDISISNKEYITTGGFTGFTNGDNITFLNCYCVGTVPKGTTPYTNGYWGGFIGADDVGLVYVSCYWDYQSSGQTIKGMDWDGFEIDADIIGHNTCDMGDEVTYVDYDFDTIWLAHPPEPSPRVRLVPFIGSN